MKTPSFENLGMLALDKDIFCVGAVEVCPGIFFGLAKMPDAGHMYQLGTLLGWKFHATRKIKTNVQPFIAIGHGLEIEYDKDGEKFS